RPQREPHPFPTRRSSDLLKEGEQRGLEKGLKEGEQRGKLEAMRQMLVNIVRARFPRLVSLAKTQVARIDDLDALDDLILKVTIRSEEHTSELQSRFDLVC